ncbi:peptidase M20 domain-containing protein 2-like [Tropilaelaps mercedesae]|uniref:Peptidase M20 domain-containing protein 2-like n=1 Tax=Tropilaelaps mercedesae TaxID=418985 RepID=A0A1V9WZR2_9ACAR|nr:peptidase M20 domain-containing protein 2-like [Tropilaelaps mercedesae]
MEPIVKGIVDQEFAKRRPELEDISIQIRGRRELALNEVFAHNFLSAFLERNGFAVQRNFVLPTDFIGESDTPAGTI